MTTVLNGLLGGAVAGFVAAATARFVGRLLAARSTSGTLPEGSSMSRPRELAAGLIYGATAGALLVVVDLYLLGTLGVPPATGEALALTAAWSGGLLAALVVVRRLVPGRGGRPRPGELLAYHAVYALCLGVWIRATWIT